MQDKSGVKLPCGLNGASIEVWVGAPNMLWGRIANWMEILREAISPRRPLPAAKLFIVIVVLIGGAQTSHARQQLRETDDDPKPIQMPPGVILRDCLSFAKHRVVGLFQRPSLGSGLEIGELNYNTIKLRVLPTTRPLTAEFAIMSPNKRRILSFQEEGVLSYLLDSRIDGSGGTVRRTTPISELTREPELAWLPDSSGWVQVDRGDRATLSVYSCGSTRVGRDAEYSLSGDPRLIGCLDQTHFLCFENLPPNPRAVVGVGLVMYEIGGNGAGVRSGCATFIDQSRYRVRFVTISQKRDRLCWCITEKDIPRNVCLWSTDVNGGDPVLIVSFEVTGSPVIGEMNLPLVTDPLPRSAIWSADGTEIAYLNKDGWWVAHVPRVARGIHAAAPNKEQ